MKIVCISDTHGWHRKLDVPEGDVLIHAGDFTSAFGVAEKESIEDFNRWLGRQPHRHKIVVAGNHDKLFEQSPAVARALLTNATYLEDSFVMIDEVLFYGSPWQPWFHDWAFNLKRGKALAKVWEKIPRDVDILITHGPAMNILDRVRGLHVGCEELAKKLPELPRLKAHVFGHIHCARGMVGDAVKYINAAVCNESYEVMNSPIVVEI